MTPLIALLAVVSGVAVGFVLGLIGGGGSILALPLLVYVVGIPSVHVAIGTSAAAVALNAMASLVAHAQRGNVKWGCATTFAAAGIIGALSGAHMGKAFDGQKLLALFGLVMILVGANMLRSQPDGEDGNVRLTRSNASAMLPKLIGIGFGVGLMSGFFGIGGGFLIVPGLMFATGMTLRNAVGTSLVAVSAFGLSTAGSYAFSGLVDWKIGAMVVAGGVAGAFAGTASSAWLGRKKRALSLVFAGIVILVGLFIVVRGIGAFL
ncbi:MAG: sulfite exporter TauE/SafE family protein [Hyphomicrobiales bacterium]|nr:sulfite exporter TauE/SafE family protein [Hyphomicrobiales bacterium]